jgi:hypothetical protein
MIEIFSIVHKIQQHVRVAFNLIIAIVCFTSSFAQNTAGESEILSNKQIAELFPDSILRNLNITYPIYRVYKYQDKQGMHYCILCESRNQITTDGDTLNQNIKAIGVTNENGKFVKVWEINDNIIRKDKDENSIRFWTRYLEIKDYDADGLVDPVIIYGTFGPNGYDDGRIKIIILYKGQKIAIRHQNGILDGERETQVDKSFYSLPVRLQEAIKQKMKLMEKNGQAIFTVDWQHH